MKLFALMEQTKSWHFVGPAFLRREDAESLQAKRLAQGWKLPMKIVTIWRV